jgi:signal transduction histidine kinase
VRKSSFLRSSTFRLALIYMVLFGASVLLLLSFIYWSTAAYMANQADATIEAEIAGLAERYRTDGLNGLTASISERISRKPGGYSIYLLADDLRPRLGNINRWPVVVPDEDGWLSFSLEAEGWPAGEAHLARARAFQLRGGFRLLVGRDLHELERTRQLIGRTLGWGLAFTLILGLVGGAMMTRSMLRRIETINQTGQDIMAGDLSRRIPMNRSGDEFDVLAGNLNAMLDRIESLMEEVRRISDNIAHDLKTPLSRLKNSLELLKASPAADTDTRAALSEQAVAEADGLLSTFNALLRIARIESGERRAAFASVELDRLLRDVVEFYEPLAEEKGQLLNLRTGPGGAIAGDRDLLFQAFANLLDNAIKYTPEQGRIDVSIEQQTDRICVTVADSGPGIPVQEGDKVLRRFYRLEASRSQPGNGLGLSLVAAVAKLHDCELRLEDNAPGLRISMAFPNPDHRELQVR